MTESNANTILPSVDSEEMSLRELFLKLKDWVNYLKSKWLLIIIFGIIGGGIGFLYAYNQKIIYTATLSFALEDDKAGGGGFSGAMGLASSFGIDIGSSSSGIFSGANLAELMKSRKIVEKALLNPININDKQESLAQYFIEFNKMNKSWDQKSELKNIRFEPFDRSNYTLQKDSILGVVYDNIIKQILSVSQKDKKVNILYIDVKSTNELFSKEFAESIAKEVSEFYIETRSKKAKINVSILEKQTDSIRNELNNSITGVARANDNTYNLNPALIINRTNSTKRQIDVQANTAILTQLVANLEMAKVTLRKETPLIQVIDKPILPLQKDKVSKLRSLIIGGFIASFLCILFVIGKRVFRDIL
jgi:uncharacterized protein involved in exopolysaccharide biosynthesis